MTYIHIKSNFKENPFADDFVYTLARMYERYIESNYGSFEILMRHDGCIAGTEEIIFETDMPIEKLIQENGKHRYTDIDLLYDRQKRRHTVYCQVTVFEDCEFNSEDFIVGIKKYSGIGVIPVATCREVITVSIGNQTMSFCKKNKMDKDRALKVFASFVNATKNEDQVRYYVNHPYKLVKDLRSGKETKEIEKIFEGDLDLIL